MIHEQTSIAIAIFAVFVGIVLGISFYLGAKAKSASGYFAAHGQIPWFINGVAFAGDYLSAASFLGICGMIAFYGYDGFLYSIGYLAGWVVALFVVGEPLKRLGKFTFADALSSQGESRGIRMTAGVSALVVSLFYLIPQMVGAGTLIKPLLGFSHSTGVIIVGITVTLIVVTAGMVSTTYVQFIKGALLVFLCTGLTILILARGMCVDPENFTQPGIRIIPATQFLKDCKYEIIQSKVRTYLVVTSHPATDILPGTVWTLSTGSLSDVEKIPANALLMEAQVVTMKDGKKWVNGKPQQKGVWDLHPTGYLYELPQGQTSTSLLNPFQFLSTISDSTLVLWGKEEKVLLPAGTSTVYFQKFTQGKDVLVPGGSPTFSKLRTGGFYDKVDFLSLMLALFCGTASLPHILIRYYTVKDESAARLSTVVGIASIGFFYVLTLYLGLGAMICQGLDVTDTNMAAPLLARTFGELHFAIISAVAFTTVLGTVSGLIMAASGAVVHDLMQHGFGIQLDDHAKVRAGKIVAVIVGILAMLLGIQFEKFNVTFLVGWAFNVAASANLPSIIMVLFWKRTTREGIAASILTGIISSIAWILLSAQAFKDIYQLDPQLALVPFSQPGIVTIPLSFIVLVVVSLCTKPSSENTKTVLW